LKKHTQGEFLARLSSVHGDKYDTSQVSYTTAHAKVRLVCPGHGPFFATPANLLRGTGCPGCAAGPKVTYEEFVARAHGVHEGAYSYPDGQGYAGVRQKVEILCPAHGAFKQQPYHHLKGAGCPECGKEKGGRSRRLGQDDFLARAAEVHGATYDYSAVRYVRVRDKVEIRCPEHGPFLQTPHLHLTGQGCPRCAPRKQAEGRRSNTENFVARARTAHGGVYDYSGARYEHSAQKVEVRCPEHGPFLQTPHDHLDGHGCPRCAVSGPSAGQVELFDLVRSVRPDAVLNYRYGPGRKELDVFVPGLMLGFEYDGLPWHSSWAAMDPLNIWRKHQEARAQGIRVVSIFSDEWDNNRPVIEKTVRHLLGASPRLSARQTRVVLVPADEAATFLADNHAQAGASGCDHLGLEHSGTLVAVMSFSSVNSRRGHQVDSSAELRRFATTCSVVGGASKLFKAFLRNCPQVTRVVSYSDNRMFDGRLYEKLGFSRELVGRPDYYYVRNPFLSRYRKSNFTRARLAELPGFDPALTERENMTRMGWYRLYDCGKTRWVWVRP